MALVVVIVFLCGSLAACIAAFAVGISVGARTSGVLLLNDPDSDKIERAIDQSERNDRARASFLEASRSDPDQTFSYSEE